MTGDFEQLFEEAKAIEVPEERARFLRDACGDDLVLRRRLERMLAAAPDADAWFADPAGGGDATLPLAVLPGDRHGSGEAPSLGEDDDDDDDTRDEAGSDRSRIDLLVPGTTLLGRYRIVSLLGAGGMGRVYRADDLTLGVPVALKFLPERLAGDTRLKEVLVNEVRQARRLAHRNLSRVFDIGEWEGWPFLSMEFIEGEDLASLLRRIGALPARKAVELGCQLCAGLQAAHEAGLLHLDLKPANLMINERGELRIADFGLARLADESGARGERRLAGTPAYMAPEHLLAGQVSVRCDLYASGLVLHEMFTGRRLHDGLLPREIVAWHRSGAAPDIRDLPAALAALIRRCLSADPDERPESAAALGSELEQIGLRLAALGLHAAEPGPEHPAVPSGGPPAPSRGASPPDALKECDVVIAYAPVDDRSVIAGRSGWISQFHDHLEVRLEQLSGEPVRIWRDSVSRAGDPPAEVLELLPRAKTMVSVLSPPFVKSPGCLRGFERFWRQADREGTLRVSRGTRLLKVVKTPVPPGVAPPEFDRLFAELVGFDFYETDPETGRLREYDESFGETARQRYFERIYDLAWELRDILHALRDGAREPGMARSPEARTIFLAETTSDLQFERDALRRELLERGHRVVPERPLPLTGPEFEREVRLLLEECEFAVHLIGARYGMVPEDTEGSVVELQNRIAAEHAATHRLERFIWMPRRLEPKDARQAAFVHALVEDPEAHRGGEVIQDSMENLKHLVLQRLAVRVEARSGEAGGDAASVAAADDGARPLAVYLIFERQDEPQVEVLEDLLFDLGFEVMTPHFDGDEAEITRVHRQNLLHCDAALVYYGSGSRPWVEMKLMDLMQAPGFGRTRELLAKSVLVTPSDDRRKSRFRTHLADVIRPDSAEIDAAILEPFTARLRAGGMLPP